VSPDRPVYVIDDDYAVRESLSVLLNTAGIERRIFATGEEFLAALKGEEPICALVDVFLPGMDGLTLQQRLADRRIESVLVFMTGQADVPMAVQAMRAGALHFIEKPFDPEDILEVVSNAVIRLSDLKQRRAERDGVEARLQRLTRREREVLVLLVEGHPNKVVAARLGISTRTVEHHRSHIMAKMQARTLTHLIRISTAMVDLPRVSRR
jgi:two-component system response regulator FixJ